MVITMAGQLKQLLIMMIFGFLVAMVYDIIRVFRRSVKHNIFYINVEDALFWLLCTFGTFLVILRLNLGEIRLFLFFGMFTGVLLYLSLISAFFLKILTQVLYVIKAFVKFILYPFQYLLNILKTNFKQIVNIFKKPLKKFYKCVKLYLELCLKHLRIIFNKK